MGAVQLSDDVIDLIDRQIAEGHAPSASAFVARAVRHYLGHLGIDDELAAEVRAGIRDIEAGDFIAVASEPDMQRLQAELLADLRRDLRAPA